MAPKSFVSGSGRATEEETEAKAGGGRVFLPFSARNLGENGSVGIDLRRFWQVRDLKMAGLITSWLWPGVASSGRISGSLLMSLR